MKQQHMFLRLSVSSDWLQCRGVAVVVVMTKLGMSSKKGHDDFICHYSFLKYDIRMYLAFNILLFH